MPFGFVIQFSIIFMLATSSTRSEMISVTSRHATCTTICPWGGASTTALFGPFDRPLLGGPHPRRLSRSRLQTDSFEHDWPQSSICVQSRLGLGMHINARKAKKELMTNVP